MKKWKSEKPVALKMHVILQIYIYTYIHTYIKWIELSVNLNEHYQGLISVECPFFYTIKLN